MVWILVIALGVATLVFRAKIWHGRRTNRMAQDNPTWFRIHSGLMACGAVLLMLGPFLLPLGPFCLAIAVGLAVILNGFVFGRSERAQH